MTLRNRYGLGGLRAEFPSTGNQAAAHFSIVRDRPPRPFRKTTTKLRNADCRQRNTLGRVSPGAKTSPSTKSSEDPRLSDRGSIVDEVVCSSTRTNHCAARAAHNSQAMAYTETAMKFIAHIMLLALTSIANAQTSTLSVNSRIKLPKENVEGRSLVSSLDQLLGALQIDIEGNKRVYPPQLLQTAILLDEIKDLTKEKQGEEPLNCRPHLSNAIPLTGGRYFVQISYIGTEEGIPVIKANVELIAHRSKDGYLFSSPLVRNTNDWRALRIGNMTFHYRGTMNFAKAQEYHGMVASYDRRLNSAPKEIAFYFFQDDLEVQQAIGLPYKLEYNGQGGSVTWNTYLEKQEVHLLSQAKFESLDPHDLWHNRLSKVKPRREVNHAVDEGLATLYGGSWGLTWDEMFAAFQKQIDLNEGTDWLDLREKKVSFETKGHKNQTDFMINALFVKKIEREKGFSGVWDLLNAKDETAYFEVLAKLTGINKGNYNIEVWKLLKEEIEEQNN